MGELGGSTGAHGGVLGCMGGVVGDTRAHGGEYWGTWRSSGGH